MKVKELKARLSEYPDDAQVAIHDPEWGEWFGVGHVGSKPRRSLSMDDGLASVTRDGDDVVLLY